MFQNLQEGLRIFLCSRIFQNCKESSGESSTMLQNPVSLKIFQIFPKCFRIFLKIRKYSRTFKNIMVSAIMFQNIIELRFCTIQKCSISKLLKTFQNFPARMYKNVVHPMKMLVFRFRERSVSKKAIPAPLSDLALHRRYSTIQSFCTFRNDTLDFSLCLPYLIYKSPTI